MANKKRMEQDPSIDPKTGKKRQRRLKDNPPARPSITVDGIDLSQHVDDVNIKEVEDRMKEAASKYAEHHIWGTGARVTIDNDPISIEGQADRRGQHSSIFGSMADMAKAFDASGILGNMMDVAEMRAALDLPGQGETVVERSLWQTAMDVWDYPSGVRITVWRQEEQASTLITVEYMDPEQEVDEPLVKGTVEFTDERLESAHGGPELMVQQELERLKNNCDADMAAFEPDGIE